MDEFKENSMKVVSSIEEIRNKAIRMVDIVGFETGEVITLKLKSLSLMGLVRNGKVPNQLLGTAVELFEGKKAGAGPKENEVSDLAGMIDVLCQNAMVEPTYEDIGEYLTDDQKMEIFYFTQGGLNSLNSFRQVQANK